MFGYPSSIDSLLSELTRLTGDMSGVYGTPGAPASIRAAARGSFPAMNLGATDDEVYVYAFAPGLDPSSLDISIQRSLLTLVGERKVERVEDADYYLEERFSGRFRRVISVPDDIDPDQVEARYENGILQIRMARSEQGKRRQIQIQ